MPLSAQPKRGASNHYPQIFGLFQAPLVVLSHSCLVAHACKPLKIQYLVNGSRIAFRAAGQLRFMKRILLPLLTLAALTACTSFAQDAPQYDQAQVAEPDG